MTDAADGLMSHAVVMLTDDGKSFVAPSVIAAMLCVPPEFTVTVNEDDLTALNETLADVRRQTGLRRGLRRNDRERSDDDGKSAKSNHSGDTRRGVKRRGARVRRPLCWSAQPD